MPSVKRRYISNRGQEVIAWASTKNKQQVLVNDRGVTGIYSLDKFLTQFKPIHPTEKEPIVAKKNPSAAPVNVRPKKYVSQGGRLVRAIEVTEKNYVQVHNWIEKHLPGKSSAIQNVSKTPGADGKTFDVSNHRVRVHTPKGIRVAKVGEHVVGELNDKGVPVVFWVFKDDFAKKYELV